MSKRSQNYQPSDQGPGGLIKALDGLGRTRGSSATPVSSGPSMISPQPQRPLQAQIDNMNNNMRRTSIGQGHLNRNAMPNNRGASISHSQGGGTNHQRNQSSSTVASTQDQGVRVASRPQGFSTSTYQSGLTQKMVHNVSEDSWTAQLPARQGGSNQGSSRRMTVNELSMKFQEKLTEVQQMILRRPNIPKDIQETLIKELRKISQEFNDQQRGLQQHFDKLKKDRDDLRRQLQVSNVDNGRLLAERKELELKHKKSSERFAEAESRWQRIQEELIEKVQFQKDQLDAKRALWLEANPGSSARRDAMKAAIRNPYESPTANHTPAYAGGQMSSMASSSVMSPLQNAFRPSNSGGPPKMQFSNAPGYIPVIPGGYNAGFNPGDIPFSSRGGPRDRNAATRQRKGTLPTGMASSTAYQRGPLQYSMHSTTHHTYHTEPGTPPPSSALVIHKSEAELAGDYKAAIGKLYELVENWTKDYSSIPNQKNDRAIASGNDILWDYMMNCTYPGHRQDSYTHVVALLSDPSTRHWFVMRMATQYCVKDIMHIKAFKPYSERVEQIIDTVLEKLQERGLNNEARQQYIDQGSQAVQSVVSAKDYNEFRAKQLGVHTKALRDMLGPMLNDNVERASAGKDLGAIAVHSWDLSVKMHTERLTFQIYFPETASKFTAATMKAKDNIRADPMQLQIQQTRLKLVITPVITMRDDRGTTIKAKSIHSSNVLLMK